MASQHALRQNPPPPVNRMTNRCKNITLPQTSFAGGKNRFFHTFSDCITPTCEILDPPLPDIEGLRSFNILDIYQIYLTRNFKVELRAVNKVKVGSFLLFFLLRMSLVPPVPADHYFIGVIMLNDRNYFWLSDAPEALLQSPVDCILSRGVGYYIEPQSPDLKTNQMCN